jgi:hypothetical protein
VTIDVDGAVRHALYPELGHGRVLTLTDQLPRNARVHWPAANQTSTHAVSSLRPAGEDRVDPREALARAGQFCATAGRHSRIHDHALCLVEADQVLVALAAAGYQLVGITDLNTLQEATSDVARASHQPEERQHP